MPQAIRRSMESWLGIPWAAAVRAAMPDMDEEMRALARQTLDKLDAMSDADFEAKRFQFTDE
mgnify:CR=1 FL=1